MYVPLCYKEGVKHTAKRAAADITHAGTFLYQSNQALMRQAIPGFPEPLLIKSNQIKPKHFKSIKYFIIKILRRVLLSWKKIHYYPKTKKMVHLYKNASTAGVRTQTAGTGIPLIEAVWEHTISIMVRRRTYLVAVRKQATHTQS